MASTVARTPGNLTRSMAGLLAATALTSRGRFDSFGAAIAVKPSRSSSMADAVDRVSESFEFGVDEARRRLDAFIKGRQVFRRFGDFTSYLSDKLLRLETRTYEDGRSANYVVDEISRKAVPAASVDRRLTRDGVRKMFGRGVELEAVDRAAARKDRTAAVAIALRTRIYGSERQPARVRTDGWDGLDFLLRAAGLRYTVQGGKAWVGREFAVASSDPAENLRIFERAKAQGIKLVVPGTTAKEARAGKLAPGMPILVRADAAPATMVDRRLGHGLLRRAFGIGLAEHTEKAYRKSRIERGEFGANVVSINRAEFARQFLAVPDPAPPTPAHAFDFNAPLEVKTAPKPADQPYSVRRNFDEGGKETYVVIAAATNAPVAGGLKALSPGLYRKEDAFGIDVGWMEIAKDGKVKHFDLKMKLVEEPKPDVHPDVEPKLQNSFAEMLDGVEHGFETAVEKLDEAVDAFMPTPRAPGALRA